MSRPPPPPASSGAAVLLMLTLGGLVAVAAEPDWRGLTAPLLGLLLVTVLVLASGARRGETPPAPPARAVVPRAVMPPSPPVHPAKTTAPRPAAPTSRPVPRSPAFADLSPREFELRVAALLSALPGWYAQATRGSADQGADVLASGPGGVRVAVQVKRYRAAVGNGAVQEIVASKALYGCAHAVVVTSGPGYTRAARQLAQANGVRLWQARELSELQRCAERGLPPPPGLLPGPS